MSHPVLTTAVTMHRLYEWREQPGTRADPRCDSLSPGHVLRELQRPSSRSAICMMPSMNQLPATTTASALEAQKGWPITRLASLALLLIPLIAAGCTTTQKLLSGSSQESSKDRVEVIPFTLTESNNISIAAVLNERDPVQLMFHTAVNSVSLTRAAGERLTSVSFDEFGTSQSWGGEAKSGLSRGNTLRIGERVWTELLVTESERSGPLTDGKFGCNLFAGMVIEIDFEECELRLHPELPTYVLEDPEFNCFETRQDRGSMFIEGSFEIGGKRYQHEFMVHTGFGGSILLDDAFVAEHGFTAAFENGSTRDLRDSNGHVLTTQMAMLSSLSFGNAGLANVPVELFGGAIAGQKVSIVGSQVLKQFDIFIASDAKRLYLRRG